MYYPLWLSLPRTNAAVADYLVLAVGVVCESDTRRRLCSIIAHFSVSVATVPERYLTRTKANQSSQQQKNHGTRRDGNAFYLFLLFVAFLAKRPSSTSKNETAVNERG